MSFTTANHNPKEELLVKKCMAQIKLRENKTGLQVTLIYRLGTLLCMLISVGSSNALVERNIDQYQMYKSSLVNEAILKSVLKIKL